MVARLVEYIPAFNVLLSSHDHNLTSLMKVIVARVILIVRCDTKGVCAT